MTPGLTMYAGVTNQEVGKSLSKSKQVTQDAARMNTVDAQALRRNAQNLGTNAPSSRGAIQARNNLSRLYAKNGYTLKEAKAKVNALAGMRDGAVGLAKLGRHEEARKLLNMFEKGTIKTGEGVVKQLKNWGATDLARQIEERLRQNFYFNQQMRSMFTAAPTKSIKPNNAMLYALIGAAVVRNMAQLTYDIGKSTEKILEQQQKKKWEERLRKEVKNNTSVGNMLKDTAKNGGKTVDKVIAEAAKVMAGASVHGRRLQNTTLVITALNAKQGAKARSAIKKRLTAA